MFIVRPRRAETKNIVFKTLKKFNIDTKNK